MAKVARGKALVAKLRADPKVRDAEALAAELGRRKALRHAAKKAKKAVKKAGVKGGEGHVPTTTAEAAKLIADTFEKVDPRVKGDVELKAQIERNYNRMFGDSVEKASPEKRRALSGALVENAQNTRFAQAIEQFGAPAVVLKKHNLASDTDGAEAEQRGPVTIVYDNPKLDFLPSGSSVEIGGANVDPTLPGMLRHEFGHHVERQLPGNWEREFRASLPDGQTMKGDLSYYAGIEWKNFSNHSEPFAELVSLITSPGYRFEDVPERMKPAAKLVQRWLHAQG